MNPQPTEGSFQPKAACSFPPEAPAMLDADSPVQAFLHDDAAVGPAGVGDGLIPQTLAPLLKKRLALKNRLAELPAWHPQRQADKQRASAHKWLLVTCFGYLGYKNARFGRIEAHEAVTACGREALLRAKEAAEDLGFTILHMYVDGMWVHKPGINTAASVQPLLQEIKCRTGLPIALEGIYRWVAFLGSRPDSRVPVPNRYFGVFQDGSLKVRGIEARRGDTPSYIVRVQLELLERLAQTDPPDLAAAQTWLRSRLAAMRRLVSGARRPWVELERDRVRLEDLVVEQRLSRELDEYSTPSPAARAALQLQALGRTFRPGQHVRFLYTRGDPGVYAWDLPAPPDPRTLDIQRYTRLFERAAQAVLEPFGVQDWKESCLTFARSDAIRSPRPGSARCPATAGK
jgi:DNA polymerase-2